MRAYLEYAGLPTVLFQILPSTFILVDMFCTKMFSVDIEIIRDYESKPILKNYGVRVEGADCIYATKDRDL